MPLRLRAAVDRVMFGASHRQHVIRVVALHSFDELHGDGARQERVFPVGFLAAAPARVAENVDVRRPERQAAPPFGVAVVPGSVIVELRAAFNADDVPFLMKQFWIPRGGHADRLRKNSGDAVVGDAVQRFVPIIIGRQARAAECEARRFATARLFRPATSGGSDHSRALGNGCDGSRQIGGSLISGIRLAAAEKGFRQFRGVESDDRRARGILHLERVEFRGALARRKRNCQRPLDRVVLMLDRAGDVTNLSRAAGRGNDVEIRGQRDIAGSHVEQPFARRCSPAFPLRR